MGFGGTKGFIKTLDNQNFDKQYTKEQQTTIRDSISWVQSYIQKNTSKYGDAKLAKDDDACKDIATNIDKYNADIKDKKDAVLVQDGFLKCKPEILTDSLMTALGGVRWDTSLLTRCMSMVPNPSDEYTALTNCVEG